MSEENEKDDDKKLSQEQEALLDANVSEMFDDGLINVGANVQLKFAVFKIDEKDVTEKINELMSEKNDDDITFVKSIQETIVTDKHIVIWYYE